jgi:hypothetical protein
LPLVRQFFPADDDKALTKSTATPTLISGSSGFIDPRLFAILGLN